MLLWAAYAIAKLCLHLLVCLTEDTVDCLHNFVEHQADTYDVTFMEAEHTHQTMVVRDA